MYPSKTVPTGAWDTHFHIFEPDKFPLAAGRHFTPAAATLEQLQEFERSIGVDHFCIAHGLSYGTDCTSLLRYLTAFYGKARGICVLDPDTVTDDTLDQYHAAGVRSVRLDFFRHQAIHDVEKQLLIIRNTDERIKQWGKGKWSIQIQQPHLEYWSQLRRQAASMAAPLVVDHLASVEGPSLRGSPLTPNEEMGFGELLGALKDGNIWMKISAPYRCSNNAPEYDDLKDIVCQMVDTNPGHVVWGSDWPHTQRHKDRVGKSAENVESFLSIDDKGWIDTLSHWLTEEQWQALWVDNPKKLYDYA